MPTLENCLFHGLPAVRLCASNGARATITLHGAHVVSWTSASGVEQLYLSPNARFEAGQPIRGGVPVVFPQFNARGVLPRHGFARTCRWAEVEEDAQQEGQQGAQQRANSADDCSVTLALQSHKVIKALWPHAFGCALTVALQDDSLQLTLCIRNQGSQPFTFQAALHTYLAIGAIESVRLSGLEPCDYEDCTQPAPAPIKPHTPLEPFAAIDRIYYNAPQQLQLHSAQGNLSLQQSGFSDVVVWNPGGAASACPADLPKDGFRHFLCVEAAQIGQAVELGAGEEWRGRQGIWVG